MSEDERIMEVFIRSNIDLIEPGLADLVDAFKLGAQLGWWIERESHDDNNSSSES